MLKKVVEIKSLKENADIIKKIAGKRKVGAVVKADAYGFSIEAVTLTLQNKVDFFAVASSSEAKKIADLTNKEILILTPNEQIINFKNVSYTVSSFDDIKYIEEIALQQSRKIGVHIKIDTGMSRIGFNNKIEFIIGVAYIKNSKSLILKGVFTHFASCDVKNLKLQNKKFREYLRVVKLPRKCLIHSASSYALISKYKTAGNAVRCGLAFYGGINKYGLKPIFKAYAKVVDIKYIEQGQKIGYSGTYVAKSKIKIAVLNCGYYDGINRLLSSNENSKNYFYINNKRCEILGRISMNLIAINVTQIKDIQIGDRAYFIRNHFDAKKIAKNSKTIIYELFTSLKNCDIIYI